MLNWNNCSGIAPDRHRPFMYQTNVNQRHVFDIDTAVRVCPANGRRGLKNLHYVFVRNLALGKLGAENRPH